jgi:hypothetical protein
MRMAEITDVRLKDIPALCFNVSLRRRYLQGRGSVGVLGDLSAAWVAYLLAGSSRANYGPYILTPC